MSDLRKCAALCLEEDVSCPNRDCRQWISYEEDNNCTLITVKKHGPLTLREIGLRINRTPPRVKQIIDEVLLRIRKNILKK
jgi:hypothetical protein